MKWNKKDSFLVLSFFWDQIYSFNKCPWWYCVQFKIKIFVFIILRQYNCFFCISTTFLLMHSGHLGNIYPPITANGFSCRFLCNVIQTHIHINNRRRMYMSNERFWTECILLGLMRMSYWKMSLQQTAIESLALLPSA